MQKSERRAYWLARVPGFPEKTELNLTPAMWTNAQLPDPPVQLPEHAHPQDEWDEFVKRMNQPDPVGWKTSRGHPGESQSSILAASIGWKTSRGESEDDQQMETAQENEDIDSDSSVPVCTARLPKRRRPKPPTLAEEAAAQAMLFRCPTTAEASTHHRAKLDPPTIPWNLAVARTVSKKEQQTVPAAMKAVLDEWQSPVSYTHLTLPTKA